jgi:hypothetical protein
MERERTEGETARRRLAVTGILGSALGLLLLFSLGIVDRNASSPRREAASVARPAAEAPAVAAQADADTDGSVNLPGHPELNLQLD